MFIEGYLGRQGLVRNLRDHLVDGLSAIVVGGRGMGKTTLLKQTAAALDEGTIPVVFDFQTDKPSELSRRIPEGPDPVVLLLDSCEMLLPEPMFFLKQILRATLLPGRNVWGIVWAGDMAWREWAMTHRSTFGRTVRFYPLIVLSSKETRNFLQSHLRKGVSSQEIERLGELAGGHPYLLSRVLEKDMPEYESFFSELWEGMNPEEKELMNGLIKAGSWVTLEEGKSGSGEKFSKTVLDRLASLGLVIRTLVDGAAAVKAVSPLLGEWARKKGPISAQP